MSNNRLMIIPMGVDNMNDYYTKDEINQMFSEQSGYTVVSTLPTTGDPTKIYLVGPTGSGADQYEEYVYTDDNWVKIGDTSMDLSGYVTDTELGTALAAKQDTLTAGTGIAIGTDNVISATVNTEEIEHAVAAAINDTRDSINQDLHNNYVQTQTMNDQLKNYAPKAALDGYYTKTQTDTAIGSVYAEIEDKERATSFALNDLEANKQDTLTAGTGISIGTDGTISADIPTLATVATTGDYTDLTNTPNLAAVATTGAYSDLTGTPTLATVATTGNYADLSGTPTIPTVGTGTVTLTQNGATIGTINVNDTDDKTIEIPAGGGGGGNEWYGSHAEFLALGTKDENTTYFISDPIKYSEISGTPTLATVATSGKYTDLTNTPTLATVATTGAYSDLIGTPTIYGNGVVTLTFTLDNIGTVNYDVVINNANNS